MPFPSHLVKCPLQQPHANVARGGRGPLVGYADQPSRGTLRWSASRVRKRLLREEEGRTRVSRGGTALC